MYTGSSMDIAWIKKTHTQYTVTVIKVAIHVEYC